MNDDYTLVLAVDEAGRELALLCLPGPQPIVGIFAGPDGLNYAQRAVACLNACKGYTTAWLEHQGSLRQRRQGRYIRYGWQMDPEDADYIVPKPSEAAVVDLILDMDGEGLCQAEIGRRLTELGLHPRMGKGHAWPRAFIGRVIARNKNTDRPTGGLEAQAGPGGGKKPVIRRTPT